MHARGLVLPEHPERRHSLLSRALPLELRSGRFRRGPDRLVVREHRSAVRSPCCRLQPDDDGSGPHALDWRTGEKPLFTEEEDELHLTGIPVDPDPPHYIATHGVGIRSYLWRRFLFSEANILPQGLTDQLLAKARHREGKIALNTHILDRVVDSLRTHDIPFLFVVFHYLTPDQPEFMVSREDNWRDQMLRAFLEDHHVPYIWSKDVIRRDPAWTGANLDRYMIMSNGHPTTYLNELIAEEMKRMVLEVGATPPRPAGVANVVSYEQQVKDLVAYIPTDSTWWRNVQQHAREDSISVEARLRIEAAWSVEQGSRVVDEAIERYLRP